MCSEINAYFYSRHKINPKGKSWQKIKCYDGQPLLDGYIGSLVPYLDVGRSLPDELIKLKLEEELTILRTIDQSVDGLFSDFSGQGKIDIADFMEKNFMFNLPL